MNKHGQIDRAESPLTILERAGLRRGASQVRLAVAIPALLVLSILAFGLISYQLFAAHWSDLESAGSGEIARRLLRGHMFAMLGLALLTLAAGSALAVSILRPIRALNEAARSVSRGRPASHAPSLAASAELGSLSQSFNGVIDFLNESIQERNRHLMKEAAAGLLMADMEGRLTAVNAQGASLLQLGATQLVGRRAADLAADCHSPAGAFWAFVQSVLESQAAPAPEEIELATSDEPASLMVAASWLCDADGSPYCVLVHFRDAEEIRRLNAQLSKTDQLAALGSFTMGLAHELRNPMAAIKGMSQLLTMQGEESPERQEYLDRVIAEVDRLDRFIRELQAFSGASPCPPAPAQVNDLLRRALDDARQAVGVAAHDTIEFALDLGPTPEIPLDADQICAAFANIILNGLESASAHGALQVRTRLERDDDGEAIEVRIRNTGSTIAPEHRSKVFDPFFTTREKQAGLGLSVAYRTITQNLGSLDLSVESDSVTFIARFRVWPSPLEATSSTLPTAEEDIA